MWAECELPFTGWLLLSAAALTKATCPHARADSNRSKKSPTVRDVSTTAPRLLVQIIMQHCRTQTALELFHIAEYTGHMIASPPVHKENLFQVCDIDDKRKSTRQPQGGSIGYSIYIPTAICQVG